MIQEDDVLFQENNTCLHEARTTQNTLQHIKNMLDRDLRQTRFLF